MIWADRKCNQTGFGIINVYIIIIKATISNTILNYNILSICPSDSEELACHLILFKYKLLALFHALVLYENKNLITEYIYYNILSFL